MSRFIAGLAALVALAASQPLCAQNLFEVQVFPDETLAHGETSVEFHNVVMPSGTRLSDEALDPSPHVHLSVEVAHGWTNRFETAVFVETSPFNDDRHAGLTGFHFRPKFRLAEWPPLPLHVSISLEYAFLKEPGDADLRQALALTPIFERHLRRFEMSFNPTLEVALKGPDAGTSPVFAPSAKLASRTARSLWLGLEYYAETGSIKRLEPLAEQHHLLIPVVDVRTSSHWDLNVGIGRGLTGGSEHWVIKTILARSFPRH